VRYLLTAAAIDLVRVAVWIEDRTHAATCTSAVVRLMAQLAAG
jgi:hypothetical protein